MSEMTSRERMMTAMRHGMPDRVPAAPDISNMVPCRLTGKPFWEIYVSENPPLWKAYIDAVRHYGMDGWFVEDGVKFTTATKIGIDRQIEKKDDHWSVSKIYHTPDGDLKEVILSKIGDAPTTVEKMIKNFKNDYKKIRHLFSEVTGYDVTLHHIMKKEIGEDAVMSNPVAVPGLHTFIGFFNGNMEAAVYAYMDEPELFQELCELYEKREMKRLEILLDLKIDAILTGGSGSLTLQSPEIWRELSLPALKKITKLCKEAGVISGIHSCGKEQYLIETCANETDLDYVNPLEIPPMGDSTIAGIREKIGGRLCLMGNLHTTNTMLFGGVDDVKRESLKAILDGGVNGNFILSTGDQCGRDTPEANIYTMVETVKQFGRYPLDADKIMRELQRLG
jgi:uroporphyrinogen decarboxylase